MNDGRWPTVSHVLPEQTRRRYKLGQVVKQNELFISCEEMKVINMGSFYTKIDTKLNTGSGRY